MPPAAVLIDLYETLVSSDWAIWRDTIASHVGVTPDAIGRAFTSTRPARSIGVHPDEEADMTVILEAAGIEPTPRLVRELVDAEREFFVGGIRLFPDSLPTVRQLRAAGIRTALVSNCSHNTRPTIHRLGLEEEFDAVILSFEVGARKPQPDIYLAALEALQVRPSEAIFVDDQAEYCDGAKALGIDTRLIFRWDDPPEPGSAGTNGHRPIGDLTPLLSELG
jgi:putative hydrolase of the HAD superfamily